MKKIAVVVILLVYFLVVASEAKQSIFRSRKSGNPKFRVSAGTGLAFDLGTKEDGKIEDIINSYVFTARLGYSPWKYIEIQGESSQFLGGFKKDSSLPSQEKSDVIKFTACAANLKILFPLKIKKISFSSYAVGGFGRVRFRHDITIKNFDDSGQTKDEYITVSCYGTCFKMGAGIDVFLSKNLFVFSEFSYWKNNLKIQLLDKLRVEFQPYYSVAAIGIGSKF